MGKAGAVAKVAVGSSAGTYAAIESKGKKGFDTNTVGDDTLPFSPRAWGKQTQGVDQDENTRQGNQRRPAGEVAGNRLFRMLEEEEAAVAMSRCTFDGCEIRHLGVVIDALL